jgi:hypothetical protein
LSSWPEELCCPYCEGGLTETSPGELRCGECRKGYPAVGGIPVLIRDPEKWVANWRYRLADFLSDNEHSRNKILAQLATSAPLPTTRARLEKLRSTLLEHRDRLLAICEAAGLSPTERAAEELAPVPGEGSITSYYHQIHRDWGWEADGNTEAQDALDEVSEVIEDGQALGRTLVLGAGGARLARDLHQHHDASFTLALDLNPLPFLIAARLLAAEPVDLFELPIRPPTLAEVAVDRHLPAQTPLDGFHLLFADGLNPPLRPGTIDTLVTPWFIDQVPRDLAKLLPRLRSLLAEGGQWLNTGPLIYHPAHTTLAHRYGEDELYDLCERHGFAVEHKRARRMAYMQSPAGSQGRTERVITFRARASGQAPAAEATETDWQEDPDQPVPRFEGIARYQAPHPMFAAIAALIDGTRSTSDIARLMTERHGLPADAALPGVQAALAEIARTLGK